MLTTARRRWLTYATVAAAPLLAAGLTGCGGSDGGATTASPRASSSGTSVASSDAQFQWELRYAKCLRGHGIEVADPDPVKGAPDVVHDDAFAAASKACVGKLGDPPTVVANRGKQQQNQDAALRAAKCLRDNGYDVADPTPDQALAVPANVSEAVTSTCLDGPETP